VAQTLALQMSGVSPSANLVDLKQRIVEFVRRASMEVTPRDEGLLPTLADRLPPGTTVYVSHTPKASLDEVVRVALRLEVLGLRASPHIVARRLPSDRALRDALRELRDGGVEQMLLVAGDLEGPLGPFANSLDVIETRALADSGMRRVGVAGHPEGHKAVGPQKLLEALHRKQEFSQRTGIRVHIVSQFGFNPLAICEWCHFLDQRGIELPIHVGLFGPTSIPKLIRFAMHCGVRTSLHRLMSKMTAMSNVARVATSPDEMVSGLVDRGVGFELGRIVQPHFFTFGGAMKSAKWLRAVGDGAFELRPDGSFSCCC
jgi:methylenetetrahydrofolate reductase (NADPH)